MLTFLGHEVVRENHVGDWGRPFGILIEQLVESGAAGSSQLTLAETSELYKVATQRFADDPDFAERARARVVDLQRRQPETLAVWQLLLDLSEAHWQGVYSKLGVLLTVDDVVGESSYEDADADRHRASRRRRAGDRSQTVPRSCSRRGSPTARASRCR